MAKLKSLFALFGFLSFILFVFVFIQYGNDIKTVLSMNGDTRATYGDMWMKLKETGNSADATVWRLPLEEGVSIEDAEEAMQIVANDANIKAVGELPLSEQVAMQTGQDQRFLKIFQFCDPETAMKMVDYSDAFAAYLPCRVAMVEGKDGQVALYSLNMDLMIHGGTPLPADLLEEANRIKQTIQKIMSSGASGDFF